MSERPARQCPFLKQNCIKERCELYARIKVAQPGQLLGTGVISSARGCIFNLLAILLGQPLPPPLEQSPPAGGGN